MLTSLTIRTLLLCEQIVLDFGAGLTVLTGETGAGKSLILRALALVLGARSESGLVRPGADHAVITATFEMSGPVATAIKALCEDKGLPFDDLLILRRQITPDGRSRAFLNETPVTAQVLKEVGGRLAELHGQFQTTELMDDSRHVGILDAVGQIDTTDLRTAWTDWRAAEQACTTAQDNARNRQEHLAFLDQALEVLHALAPQPGEEATLDHQRTTLMQRDKYLTAYTAVCEALAGDDGATAQANRALAELERLADETLAPVITTLEQALAEVETATQEVQSRATDLEQDDRDVEAIEARLFDLRAQARRHGVAVDALPALMETFAQERAALTDVDATLEGLHNRCVAARQAYIEVATAVATDRREAGEGLARLIVQELAPLKLGKATFAVAQTPLEESRWGPNGTESIAFIASTNPGLPPGPLSKIASGGELSRFMLALKVVLARTEHTPLLVFDEVDSGVGGATADAVGERLMALGQQKQVLVITHSPQVAARATAHFQLNKTTTGATTTTTVLTLTDSQRIEELARMLSGATVTPEALAAAKRLLDENIGLTVSP